MSECLQEKIYRLFHLCLCRNIYTIITFISRQQPNVPRYCATFIFPVISAWQLKAHTTYLWLCLENYIYLRVSLWFAAEIHSLETGSLCRCCYTACRLALDVFLVIFHWMTQAWNNAVWYVLWNDHSQLYQRPTDLLREIIVISNFKYIGGKLLGIYTLDFSIQ